MIVSASTNQKWTKITIRSYAWSFGHSDPDPSNVTQDMSDDVRIDKNLRYFLQLCFSLMSDVALAPYLLLSESEVNLLKSDYVS